MQVTLIKLSKFILSPTNANQMLISYFPYIKLVSSLKMAKNCGRNMSEQQLITNANIVQMLTMDTVYIISIPVAI